MKKLSLLICILLPLLEYAQPSSYRAGNIAPELLLHANSVVRNNTTRITIDDLEKATVEITYAVTVLNQEADDKNSYYEVEDEFEKIKTFEAKLFNAAGELIRETTKKDVETFGDFSTYGYSDGSTRRLKIYDAQYPYTVEFTVKKVLRGYFLLPEFEVQEQGQSLEYGHFTLNAPKDYTFKWKGVNTTAQPVITTQGKSVEWNWEFKNVAAVPIEKYTSSLHGEYAGIRVTPENVKIDDYEGSFENWNQIGRFFYIMNRDRDNLSPELNAKVGEMTAGMTNNRAKIDTLYHFMQNTCRYVSIQLGIGGWQTFDAKFVETKKYGDCKALSNFMKALLKSAGIPAWQALVYGGRDGARPLYDEAPAPLFNHVILYVPGEDIWLECTSNNIPAGYLGPFTSNRPVLLLTPEGGKKVNTPTLSNAQNTIVTHTTLQLKEDGHTLVNSVFTATGEQHEYYRNIQAIKKQDEMEKAFIASQEVPVGKINRLQIASSASTAVSTVDFEGIMDGYATRSGKRIFVPLNKFHPFKRTLVADDQRFHDICMSSAYKFIDTIKIVLPPGYKAENIPGSKTIDSVYGHYKIDIQNNGDHLMVTRNIVMEAFNAPAAQYNDIRKIYLDMGKADAMQVVLIKTE